jgi:hypothetical protein
MSAPSAGAGGEECRTSRADPLIDFARVALGGLRLHNTKNSHRGAVFTVH